MSERPYWNQFLIQMDLIDHTFCTEELEVLFENLSDEEFREPHKIPTTYEAYLLCDLEEIAGKEFDDLLDAAEEFGGGDMIAHHDNGPTAILKKENVDNYKQESDEEL